MAYPPSAPAPAPTPQPAPAAPAPQPVPAAPAVTPVPQPIGFPANTPVAEMTAEQQAAYHLHYSRQHETREKEERALRQAAEAERAQLAQELAAIKAATQTDQEKAIEAARAEGRMQALRDAAERFVEEHFKAATANRLTDEQRTALLAGLDRKQFLSADGMSVDTAKVNALVDAIAPAATATPPAGPQPPVTGAQRPDLGQGRYAPTARSAGLDAGRELARKRFGTQGGQSPSA